MDEILFRVLKNGNQYNSLFPTSTGEIVELGKGDTDYSIDKMVEWIKLHKSQTSKVAPLLAKSSLQNTCKSIHDFCYWHFQYKADNTDQLLRSPAAAWKQRYDGIDCKSYSIIASCLLLNLDINHYIRKVAYTTPGEYTHVYVIVPHNQETNNLDDGFYMIDGTIDTMQEPFSIDEKDEYMSLQHYGLNAPNHYNQLNGISLSDLKKVNLSSIKKLGSLFGCIGGSAYTGGILDANLNKLHSFFDTLIAEFNQHLAAGNFQALAEDYTDLAGWSHVFVQGHNYVQNEGDWNSCTVKNLTAFLRVARFYLYQNNEALDAFINKYFDKQQIGTITYTNVGLESQGWKFMETSWGVVNEVKPLYKLTPKNIVQTIPAFEYTAPMINSLENNAPLDVQGFLQTLVTVAYAVQPNQNTNPGTITDGGNYATETGANTTSKSGFGWILGIAILAAGYGAMKSTNESDKKPKTTVK